jgi:hypothetical protein
VHWLQNSSSETSRKIGAWTRGLKFEISESSQLRFHGDVVLIIAHSRSLRFLGITGNGAPIAMLLAASQVASSSLQHLKVCLSGTPQMIGAAFFLIGTFKKLKALNVESYASEHGERVVASPGLEFAHLTELTLNLLSFDPDAVTAVFLAFLNPSRLPRMVGCHLLLGSDVRPAECRGFEAFFDRHPQLKRYTLVASLYVKRQLLPHIAAPAVRLSEPPHPDILSVLPSQIEELVFGFDMDCKAGCAHAF